MVRGELREPRAPGRSAGQLVEVGGTKPIGIFERHPWYELVADPTAIRSAVSWVLAQECVTGFASPGDARVLPAVLATPSREPKAQRLRCAFGPLPGGHRDAPQGA